MSTKDTTPESTAPDAKPAGKNTNKTILLGFDFGTNKSCVVSGFADSDDIEFSKLVPTINGYVQEGIITGIIPGNADILYGEEALKNSLHVKLVNPLGDGVVADSKASKDFVRFIRTQVDESGSAEIRAVIGLPANADGMAHDHLRDSVAGVFDRIILIPEPFLAALGVREDSRLGQDNYVDPVTNSLFVDIGAGTSDLCLVQGYYPTAADQVSFPSAGDFIDERILEAINMQYPNNGISNRKIREIKEAHSYVGGKRKPIEVEIVIGGKGRMIELGHVIGDACNELFEKVLEATKVLIGRANSDSIEHLLQNIIVTGGGSQIRGIDVELQKRLTEEGYKNPKVHLAGEDYARYVGIGALKAARQAREAQWQYVLK